MKCMSIWKVGGQGGCGEGVWGGIRRNDKFNRKNTGKSAERLRLNELNALS